MASASMAAMLAARRAPAQNRGTALHILQWAHFIPAYDAWFDKLAKEWGDRNGVQVRVNHIPHLDLPARFAAEFAAGTGHDLMAFSGQVYTWLYHRNLLDLSDLADNIGRRSGGWIPTAASVATVQGRWYALPDFYVPMAMLWRKDLFDRHGLPAPETWENARVAARALKRQGHPCGIQISHCNDANLNWRSILLGFGGQEVDASGQNILIDSAATREALRFGKALFDEGMTAEVFSWDDASDNRFFASGIGCWIHDALSAYRMTEDTSPTVFRGAAIALVPLGPTGKRLSMASPNAYAIWKFAKNPDAAKDFLAHLASSWKEAMLASRGYDMPFVVDGYRKPMPVIGGDAKLAVLQDFSTLAAFYGYPGPVTTPINEVVATFVLPQLFARVARGQGLDEAIRWASSEYRRIFAKHRPSG